ncbi:hypothetical protein [Methylotetracoccus oryzae]|uniref:hypothetical protein n=1 Tax=Methylotetracoccus oryzae TaxID=1919059 RepID=UPI0011181821|nr:hypothetical protein [Methylotetracoccus oryzae]
MKTFELSKLAVSVSLALASGLACAELRDHGPVNRTNFFPDWYRDADGLAMGQCINTDDAGNGPLCLLAGVDPNGFPGNFGEEGFYATADVTIPLTGGNFHWMGHLEMAYLTANGAPPATRTAASAANEVVFSRERMIFDVPAGCAGHYTVRTPFKVHEFDLDVGRRALFYTDDIAPISGDFEGALKGHTGPFLVWDHVGANDAPASAANPAITMPQPAGPARKYVGDPNIPHTFVGSTLPAGPGHEDKGFNNYVEVIPPSYCDLGAGVGVPMFEENAAVSGLIWDAPIADPVQITKAAYTRNPTAVGLDVWVSGPKNQNLVLTAADNQTQQVPSITLKEETKAGAKTGTYHAHLEFPRGGTLPAQVAVTNLTSNPQSRDLAAVVDAVVVTKSEFNPQTNTLCIAAHSGDEDSTNPLSPNPLSLEAPAYGAFGPATGSCAGGPGDVVLERNLSDFAPDQRFAPEGILVSSSKGGSERSQPVVLATGNSSEAQVSQTASGSAIDILGTGATVLPLTGDPNQRVVIVSQPEIGSVYRDPATGVVSYAAVEGMQTSVQKFFYAFQDASSGVVSNVAEALLNVTQSVAPPVGVADAQGVFRTSTGATINILNNDVTGVTTTPIDRTSVELAPLAGYTLGAGGKSLTGPRGTVTVQSDGSLRYVPAGQGGTANNTAFTVQYTVGNTSGNGRRSAPTTVTIVLKSATEAIAFQRVRFGNAWDIRFTSTYAGAAGAVTLAPAATCRLYASTAAYANGTGTPLGTVGSATPGAGTNAYVVTGGSPVPAGNTWVMGCTTTSGGRGSRTGTL